MLNTMTMKKPLSLYFFLAWLAFYAILAGFAFKSQADHAVHPEEGNALVWDGKFGSRINIDWGDGGASILAFIILHSLDSPRYIGREPVFTSFHRPGSCPHSQHCYSNAVDFFFLYTGATTDCDFWMMYRGDIEEMEQALIDYGIDDRVGFGIYHNRTMHLDFRGHRARWGFDADGNEVAYDKLLEELDEWIENSCSR